MKTLKESLFDADLATKDINFGSLWKLESIEGFVSAAMRTRGKIPSMTNSEAVKLVCNKFVMSKLKSKTKPADLSDVEQVANILAKTRSNCEEQVSYIVGMINNMPHESLGDKNTYGNKLLIDLFADVLKNNAEVRFDTITYGNKNTVFIEISIEKKGGAVGLTPVLILKYVKR